eukprot:scaffold450934_cov38-Prasinocladus_malaysianus.AAC.1
MTSTNAKHTGKVREGGGTHVTGAGRVSLLPAGKAHPAAACALRLAHRVPVNLYGSAAVRGAGAPSHPLVVLDV